MKIIILCLVMIVGVQSDNKSFYIDDVDTIEDSEPVAFRPLRYITRVLICTNKDASEQIIPAHQLNIFKIFPKMEIEFLDVTNCPREIESDRHGQKTILAVIAPKPFKNIADSEVPIYCYEAPYFLEDLGASHSNIVPALTDWRPLKYAFTRFFEQQDWIRIAIVSDDSSYSAAFEEEFVGHLNEQGLVYNVQRCVETLRSVCDFHDALSFIKENKAFIVVANIDAHNALELARQASVHSVTRKRGFLWLSRDWPFGDVPKHKLHDMGPIVSITLSPLVKESISSHLSSITEYKEPLTVQNSLDGPYLTSIVQGLALVEDAVRHTKKNRIDHFYRDIAKHMNEAIKRDTYDTQAFIRQINPNLKVNNGKVITIVVANSHSITSDIIINDFSPKVDDVRDCSMMRSSVFTDPCNDFWITLILLVVLFSILLFFLIVYVYIRYFHYFVHRPGNWFVL